MERIKIITDSACDIPTIAEHELGITILPIPITMDGKGYLERVDFTSQQFYEKLLAAKSIPTTSHITSLAFAGQYELALAEGYTNVIVVTICSGGSNMFEAAHMGVHLFHHEHPDAKETLKIDIVDSKTYTLAYGYPVMEAAKMARTGMPSAQIIAYLVGFFAQVEIYFATYTLEFVKKSGRVNCAAAFVGDVLGLRPIIAMIDGQTKIVDKVRGDKNVVPRLAEIAAKHRQPGTPYMSLRALTENVGEQMDMLLTAQFEQPSQGVFYVGASIAMNAGPRIAGLIVLGKPRR